MKTKIELLMDELGKELSKEYNKQGYTQEDFNGCVLVDNGLPDDIAEIILGYLPKQ